MFKIAIVFLQNCCMLSHIQSKQHSYHFAPFEGSIVVTNGWIIILSLFHLQSLLVFSTHYTLTFLLHCVTCTYKITRYAT